jgi:hypothetical protein
VSNDCRSGCKTKDHDSWAECARDANVRVAYSNSAGGQDYTAAKKMNKELDAYKSARAEGIQPAGTRMHQVEQALRISDKTQSAFQGG